MNTLAALRPDLAAQWHPERNGNLTPTDVNPASNKKVWWRCLTCGHDWRAVVRSRTQRGTGCPACASRKNKGIPLAEQAPELLEEWCVGLNEGPGDDVAAASALDRNGRLKDLHSSPALRAWWRRHGDRLVDG